MVAGGQITRKDRSRSGQEALQDYFWVKFIEWNLQQYWEDVESSLGLQGGSPILHQVIKQDHTEPQNLLPIECPRRYCMLVYDVPALLRCRSVSFESVAGVSYDQVPLWKWKIITKCVQNFLRYRKIWNYRNYWIRSVIYRPTYPILLYITVYTTLVWPIQWACAKKMRYMKRRRKNYRWRVLRW